MNHETGISKRYLAVIPARGGSVGLPGKNLMRIQGISLVSRAIQLARSISAIKRVILTTDSQEIAQEGLDAGAEIPFLRPRNLAQSETPMVQVLEHLVSWIKAEIKACREQSFAGLVLLAPTSPMRKRADIIGALQHFESRSCDRKRAAGVISVSPVPKPYAPCRTFRIDQYDPHSSMDPHSFSYLKPGGCKPDQKAYYRNGVVVILDLDRVRALNDFNNAVLPYVIDRPIVSIDTAEDFRRIECSGIELEPFQ